MLVQPSHLLILLLIPVLFLLTLRKALARCGEQSRTTSPGSVWLLLIPLFNMYYQFVLVGHIAKSLGNEFARRGIPGVGEKPGKQLGIAWCVLNLTSLCSLGFTSAGAAGPTVLHKVAEVAPICSIIYWVVVAGYSRKIAAPFVTSQDVGLEFLPTHCPACKQPLSKQEWKRRKCPRCGDIAKGRTPAFPAIQPAGPTMDAPKLKGLADLYQTWSTEQLVTAAGEERGLYEPQAVELIEKELQHRNETLVA